MANQLARALHQVVSDLLGGQTVELRFGSEAELRHVLEVLQGVTTVREVSVQVRAVGSRTLELSLTHAAA